MRDQMSGKPCDSDHPFPAGEFPFDFLDSMEYGAEERLGDGQGMLDTSTEPTLRLIAATIWDTNCRSEHLRAVAENQYLTTHVIACTVRNGVSASDTLNVLALNQVGAAGPMNALIAEGLEGACEVVRGLSVSDRERILAECVALLLRGLTTLRLDINDTLFVGRKTVTN